MTDERAAHFERDSYRAVALNDIMVQGMGLKSTRRTIKEVASQSLAKAKSRLSTKKMFELPNTVEAQQVPAVVSVDCVPQRQRVHPDHGRIDE